MQTTVKEIRFSKKDRVNVISAHKISQYPEGTEITASGLTIDEQEDGKKVGYIKDTDGVIYSTISPTVIDSMSAIIDYYEEEKQTMDSIVVRLGKSRSNNNREFMYLTINA